MSEFTPEGLLETELVETMAAARWRLRRVSTIETTLLTIEMDRLAESIDHRFKDLNRAPTPDDRLAWTFHRVAEKPSLNLLLRYEATLTRTYARALKQLQQLQSLRDREELPNEPKLTPTPLEPALSVTPTTPAPDSEPAPTPQRATKEVSPSKRHFQRKRRSSRTRNGFERPRTRARHHHPRQSHRRLLSRHQNQHHRHPRP
jgi:hypothetical protein